MDRLLDALLPPVCVGCEREGVSVCDACRGPLERRLGEPPGVPIGIPAQLPEGIVQLEWCAAFTGPARAALHRLKYDSERRLARPLGELLAARWAASGAGGEMLVPVPIHPDKRRQRGFNQAALLAEVAARTLELPMLDALERIEATEAQHALGRRERARNVRAAFRVAPRHVQGVREKWVIVVDDVMTTGATLAGCAAALEKAGAMAVSALTFARER